MREHMPTLVFEDGSRAVPVDFRRCRDTEMRRRPRRRPRPPHRRRPAGHRLRPRRRLPGGAGGRRSGGARLLRRAGGEPLHPVLDLLRRLGDPARRSDRRRRGANTATTGSRSRSASAPTATSTSAPPPTTATTRRSRTSPTGPSDAGIGPLQRPRRRGRRPAAQRLGPRDRLLLVSGGSHAGNAVAIPAVDRLTPGQSRPPHPARADSRRIRRPFAISPPWLKRVWLDPEAEDTE